MKLAFERSLMLLGLAALAISAASASPIVGSLPLSGSGVTQNGADLSVSTSVTTTGLIVLSLGSGGFAPVPLLTDFGPTTLDLSNINASLVSFTFNNALYGTFVPTSGLVIQRTTNFLDVFLSGNFTPGAGLPGQDPNTASVRISINQSGSSLSEAVTMNAPALQTPVPEPATMLLAGGALLGLGLIRRARKA